MKVSYLLHLYQPPFQEEFICRKIFDTCYVPLIKTIKTNKDFKLTLNIPLSLFEHAQHLGYTSWISEIKNLIEMERVEMVGSAAYHPLLTRVSREIAEKQIILQEYALGYFFGSHIGFEGEPSIVLKNIKGFFPPEMAINIDLLSILSEFGYQWSILNPSEMNKLSENLVYSLPEYTTKLVTRDPLLSDIISFSRTENITDFKNELDNKNTDVLISLDAEVFGHHNKEGIRYLENLLLMFKESRIETQFVSDFVDSLDAKKTSTLADSTWSNDYSLWENSGNAILNSLWGIYHSLTSNYSFDVLFKMPEGLENIALWDIKELYKHTNLEIANRIYLDIAMLKCLNSDQFWWASNKKVGQTSTFSKDIIFKSINLYKDFAINFGSSQFNKDVEKYSNLIYKELE